jgi:uncharacterized HhH-GPD family protein
MTTPAIRVTGIDEADELVSTDPLALVIGMLLDQQIPMEWAFKGPATLAERLGGLDASAIAAMDPDAFAAVFSAKPALHRFPGSMAKRTQELCRHITDEWGGDAGALWAGVGDADELMTRVRSLPGYGDEKSRILVAMLAKRLGVRPKGWEQATAPFSDDQPRSVADIDSPESLARVREWKKAMKAKGKSKSD